MPFSNVARVCAAAPPSGRRLSATARTLGQSLGAAAVVAVVLSGVASQLFASGTDRCRPRCGSPARSRWRPAVSAWCASIAEATGRAAVDEARARPWHNGPVIRMQTGTRRQGPRKRPCRLAAFSIAFNFHGNHDVGQQDTRRHRRQLGHRPAHRASGRRAGRRVIIGGRDRRRLDEALKTLPQNAIARQVDAFSSTSLTAFFDDLRGRHAVHARHQLHRHPFAQATEEQARSPFEGKFWPQYWAVHAALPKLAQDASVLLMSGAASARPVKGGAAYAAANAAIEGLARGWPPSWRRAASTRSRPAP